MWCNSILLYITEFIRKKFFDILEENRFIEIILKIKVTKGTW